MTYKALNRRSVVFCFFVSILALSLFCNKLEVVWNTQPEDMTFAPLLTIFCQRLKPGFSVFLYDPVSLYF